MHKTINDYLDMIDNAETLTELSKVETAIIKSGVSISNYMLLMRSLNERFKEIASNN